MDHSLLLWPMIAHALLVFMLYFELGRRRAIAAKRKEIHLSDFKVVNPNSDSDYSGPAARAVVNNFELPVLFHAVSLALFSLEAVNGFSLILGWIFIIGRVTHALILLTYNNVMHRATGFFISVFSTLGLWIILIFHLLLVK